ncbi:hemolysin family protein [Salinarimonas sp.]|uniref:hemolysin family protein n=1 Tax=Salinarimonas sp. TaxID=2766526 RepID=UPI0032D8E641
MADEPRPPGRDGWLDRLLARLGLRQRETTRADLEDLLALSVENPDISTRERAMLKNVLRFHRMRVIDVMVPRADIVAVAHETSLGEMLRVFRTAGHSRLPVYGETLDDPKGMVHIRDFLDYFVARAENGGSRRRKPKTLDAVSLSNIDLSTTLASAKILRPVLFVPPSMPAVELLVRMQTTRTHMALVIDEYGGTDGLVSIEDLVEMVVGDIEDEHDLATQAMIQASGPDTFVADARADLEEVSQVIGYDFTQGDVAEDVDTLGGLIVALAGRVPARSELIAGPENFEFEVLDADPRRLKRVRVHRRDPSLKLVPAGVATGVAGRRAANGAGAPHGGDAAAEAEHGAPADRDADAGARSEETAQEPTDASGSEPSRQPPA